jgi:hypothetical protein
MNDIITSLETLADQIAITRQQVLAEQFISPHRLRELNLIHLALIAAQHSIQSALATARQARP